MQAIPRSTARTSALLDTCRDLVLSALQKSIRKFFENSSMAFYEFAGKAQSGISQIRFMEAMSIIERNRSRVEQVYLETVRASFTRFGDHSSAPAAGSARSRGGLSLQSMEESDIQVAIQNMVDAATVGSSHTLNAIRQRLSLLNSGRKLEEDAIPGGPACLANAFHTALADLTLEHETRLVVYFLYDRVVLRKTHLLYEEYNQCLARAGILPNLIYEVRKNPAGKPPARRADETPAAAAAGAQPERAHTGESLSDSIFQDILTLLSRKDRHAQGQPEVPHPDPLPRQELVSALTELQRYDCEDIPRHNSEEIAAVTSKAQQEHLVSGMISQLSRERDRLFTGLDRRRLPTADMQVIELVGMMFEYMLRDGNIPSVAKAELSRLHTPYLKVAVLDKNLFTSPEHPAHALLNDLADAATKWVFVNNLELGIFPCLRHIVQRIIDEFDNSLDIFNELIGFLGNSVHNLEERAAAIEQRSRQAAAGKEKLAVARDRAARTIESRVTGHTVPTELRRVLGDIWLDKLMFIYLREPESDNSPAWKLATRAIESIVWSVEPRATEQERDELRQRLPDLNVQLAGTLDTLAVYGSSDIPAQLALVHRLQESTLQEASADGAPAVPEPSSASSEQAGSAARQPAGTGVLAPETYTPEPGTTSPQPLSVAPGAAEADAPEPEEIALTAAEEAALEHLRTVRFGSWFTFEQDDDRPARLVKLSWFSQVSGNYMFVDSMGVRAVTCKHHELATLMVNGKARILEDAHQPFIQRALHTIRKLLGGNPQQPERIQGSHT